MNFLTFISNFRTEFLDVFFRILSFFGELTVLLPVICIIYWCLNKTIAYYALFTFFTTGAIVQCAKITFRIPRPWIIDPAFSPVGSAIETATGYSFPSGHVQSCSSVFLALGHWSEKKILRILSWIIVVLVMLSRMYLGVHTPLDVVTSLIITCTVIFILNRIKKYYDIPSTTKLGLLILSIAYMIGIIFYSYLLVRWDISTWDLTGDAIILGTSLAGFAIGSYIENRFINFGTQCFSIWGQLIKIILGIGGMLAILYLCSLIPCHRIIEKSLSSFLVCIWATCIFPLFIKRIQKKEYHEL